MPVTSTDVPVQEYTLTTTLVPSQEIIKRKAIDSKLTLMLDRLHIAWESNTDRKTNVLFVLGYMMHNITFEYKNIIECLVFLRVHLEQNV